MSAVCVLNSFLCTKVVGWEAGRLLHVLLHLIKRARRPEKWLERTTEPVEAKLMPFFERSRQSLHKEAHQNEERLFPVVHPETEWVGNSK